MITPSTPPARVDLTSVPDGTLVTFVFCGRGQRTAWEVSADVAAAWLTTIDTTHTAWVTYPGQQPILGRLERTGDGHAVIVAPVSNVAEVLQ